MTPEERAAKLAREICVCSCYAPKAAPANCAAENKEWATADIAAAIREAVMAERIGCATLAEFGEWTPNGDDPYCGIQIAAAIRKRPL